MPQKHDLDPEGAAEALRSVQDPERHLRLVFYWHLRKVREVFPPAPGLSEFPWRLAFSSRAVVEAIYSAVLGKLRRQNPAEDGTPDAKLIRRKFRRLGRLALQARFHLEDVYRKDFLRFPRDGFSVRVDRLLPKLRTLPDRRGRSVFGATISLLYLHYVEEAFEQMPTKKAGRRDREGMKALFEPVLVGRSFDNLYEEVGHLAPREVACEYATWAVAHHVGLQQLRINRVTLLRRLPALRKLASAENAAHRKSNRP